MRVAWPLLVVLLAAGPALAGPEERVAKRAAQIEAAVEGNDLLKALKLANKLVKQNPGHARAYWERARVYDRLEDVLEGDLQQQTRAAADADYQIVIQLAPKSAIADLARTMILGEPSQPLVARPPMDCSDEALGFYEQAEERFSVRDMTGALAAYDRALELCPDDPTLWVYSGDALHALGDDKLARMRYRRAIELAPCFYMAHRFLGDVRLGEGDLVGAWEAFTSAVACKPDYDAAWGNLRDLENSGVVRDLVRRPLPSQLVVEDSGDLTINFDPGADRSDLQAWVSYHVCLDDRTMGACLPEGEVPPDRSTAMARTRFAVGRALLVEEASQGVFWPHIRAAIDAGFETEAIFLHLLHADLAADFEVFRTEHRDRMTTYVRTLVAPRASEP